MTEQRGDPEDRDMRLDLVQAELARYRTVFNAAHVGLAETDAQGIVRLANVRLATLLGLLPASLIGKPLLHFVARGDTGAFRRVVETLAQHGEHGAFVVRFRPRDGGKPFHAEVWARAARSRLARCLVWSIWALEDRSTATEARPAPGTPDDDTQVTLRGATIRIEIRAAGPSETVPLAARTLPLVTLERRRGRLLEGKR
jgi:PAS domain S-box-containing protein